MLSQSAVIEERGRGVLTLGPFSLRPGGTRALSLEGCGSIVPNSNCSRQTPYPVHPYKIPAVSLHQRVEYATHVQVMHRSRRGGVLCRSRRGTTDRAPSA